MTITSFQFELLTGPPIIWSTIEYSLIAIIWVKYLFGALFTYPRLMICVYRGIPLLSVLAVLTTIFFKHFARKDVNFISTNNNLILLWDNVYTF